MLRILATAGQPAAPSRILRYLLFEVVGALTWSATFVVLGWLLGAQWRALMARYGVGTILFVVVLITIAGVAAIVVVRLIRMRRHGPASHRAGASTT